VAGACLLAACSGGPAGPQEIRLNAKEFGFSPTRFEVTAGQPVHLTLHNGGALEHDFSVMEIPVTLHSEGDPMAGHEMEGMEEEPALHMVAAAGEDSTLEFTPTKPGTYEFFCGVPGHKGSGMTGTLVVNPP
jgi:uncharacterized cupredoxin-like copper-binding protein